MERNDTLNLAVCSSASFYKDIIALSYELEKYGVNAILPKTATEMKLKGGANIEVQIDMSVGSTSRQEKSKFIRQHFNEIARSDAILVANYTKHGKSNYVGPNVLMEMAVAFHLNKPIYVLNDCPADSPFLDEILGLGPIFLKGDISKLNKT